MFCHNCGTELADEAGFCHKCGTPAYLVGPGRTASPLPEPLQPTLTTLSGDIPASVRAANRAASTNFPSIISVILILLLIGSYAAVLIPAMAGQEVMNARAAGGGFLLLGGIAFWHFWKRSNRKGWVGAIVGVVVSTLLVILSGGITGYLKSQPSYGLEHMPMFAALKKNYPQVAEQIKAEMIVASKDHNFESAKFQTVVVAKIVAVADKALAVTSDEALLQFGKAKVQQFQEVADSNAADALSLMSGEVASADLATQKRVLAHTSKGAQDAVLAAFIKVLNDADGQRPPLAKDERRFNAIYEQLDATLKSVHGTSAYYFGNDSLKPEVRCRAGLLLYKETLNLASDDRSFMLRSFFAAE